MTAAEGLPDRLCGVRRTSVPSVPSGSSRQQTRIVTGATDGEGVRSVDAGGAASGRRPARRSVLTVLGAALVGVLGVAAAGPAAAHDELVSTDPAAGATVATAPNQVTLTFTDKAIAVGTEVKVTAPDGSVVSTGDPQLGATTVAQPLAPARPAGTYTVVWRVTSADGHPVSGTFTLVASAATGLPTPTATASLTPTATSTPTPSAVDSPAAAPTPSATPATSGPSGPLRFWPFLVVVLVVAAATSALGRRSARRPEDGTAAPKP